MTNRFMATACAALLAACGAGHASNKPANQGQVRLSAKTLISAPVTIPAPAATAVCGTITLQPYSLDAAGNMTLAGAPVTFASTATGGTDEILGCIDDGSAGNNWGYLVTASAWNDCASPANALNNVQPPIVSGNFPVHCGKGVDTALPITVDVSIATPNSAGYIDIAVTVNSTTVQTGCKAADINPLTNNLNFGESYIDPKGVIHDGLVGLDVGEPTQYAGSVNAGVNGKDTYYTGQVGPAVIPGLLFQTFLDNCPTGGDEYGDHSHAQCVTTTGGAAPATSNALADVFFADPIWGSASATIQADGSIGLYSNVAATTIEDASVTPAAVGFNTVAAQSIAAPAAPASYTGIYLDRSTAHQFLVAGLDATGAPFYATLSQAAGSWSLGAAAALPSIGEQQCMGLFQSKGGGGCFTPNCTFAAGSCSCAQPLQKQ
jgi:hypothetical protein